ncbi:hypothetical protein ASG92_06980 [Arthrobacter sp. Soil736]|uniref:ferritin-like domain-containing protein n=1 Tax=Arthrobacter sp. Soil736 TaxID=1736395 RepID=UPI0006FC9DF4|nr:ferritin-like domain-containing protein [Arthrobacter sp. Soil736]KRE53271.1 hypothetical protein ASG92_06980 [Arthrobacter sp. Soil736]
MKASQTLAGNLQRVLTDLIELHVQGKQAHWNLVGTNFRDLHLQLDEQTVKTLRDVHDEVDAEDPTSADLLHAAITRLEQLAWMVNAEVMAASASVTAPAEA